MIRAYLIDHLGYTISEPEVPEPSPQVVVWGDQLFLAGCPGTDDRPRYHWVEAYVINDTRGSGIYKL